jgi:hypothetical protein
LEADRLACGHEAGPEQVFIGRNKTNPTSVPFTIERDGLH